MLQRAAVVFGVVFILLGIFGFIPGITQDSMLLGIFHVNPAHNVVHIISGAVALFAAGSASASRLYFQLFGLLYGLIAILGFGVREGAIFGLISNNMADTWLHVGIAVISLYLGFFARERLIAHA